MNNIFKPENIEDDIYKIKIIDIDKYDQISLQEELESRRIQELLKTESLMCELFSEKSYKNFEIFDDYTRFLTINLENTCATILEIKDDYIIIKAHSKFKNLMMKMFMDEISIFARIRAVYPYNSTKDKYYIYRLITFDIFYEHLIHQQFELPPIPLPKFKFPDDYDPTKIYYKNIICKEENNNE